jgi:hypothetical protein
MMHKSRSTLARMSDPYGVYRTDPESVSFYITHE